MVFFSHRLWSHNKREIPPMTYDRTATTWNCVGITALGESPITTRFLNANSRKTPENILFFLLGRHVVFKRFLRIFCPRKWKETLCLRWKTSFKAIFRYWKTPVSNEYKPFSHLTPHSQHQENNSFRRANCQGKLLDKRTNTSIRRIENNGKKWILLSENVRKIHE